MIFWTVLIAPTLIYSKGEMTVPYLALWNILKNGELRSVRTKGVGKSLSKWKSVKLNL